jgi:hypothetical protein
VTFNTHLLSPAMCLLAEGFGDAVGDFGRDCHTEEHAVRIANYILNESPLRDQYEVIALNEVWDEDAKDILVSRLKGRYPHYISKIDDDLVVVEKKVLNAEDSGLMLFSRYPFVDLPNQPGMPAPAVGTNSRFGSPWDPVEGSSSAEGKVAFIRFGSYTGDSKWAAKGAALARIAAGFRTYSIIFTHTQDADGATEQDVRAAQLADINILMTHVLNPGPRDQDVIVMGDLNVKGGSEEWSNQFANPGSDLGSWDTWHETSSRDDMGRTSRNGTGDRLDYILYSHNVLPYAPDADMEKLCAQHMRLDFPGLSDHLGVNTIFQSEAPRCSPSRAWKNPPYDEWLHTDPDGNASRIPFGGFAQWFKVEEKGTFSFAMLAHPLDTTPSTEGGAVYEVYDGTDLTNPIGQYRNMTTTFAACDVFGDPHADVVNKDCKDVVGRTFALQGPFYIKVMHRDPKWTGNYRLVIHKHTCASKEDVCILSPNAEPYDPDWPTDKPLGEQDTAWFRVDTDKADVPGTSQDLRFYATGLPSFGDTALKAIHDASSTTLETMGSGGGMIEINADNIAAANPDLLLGPDQYYVTIRRPNTLEGMPHPTGLAAGWKTNLTIFHGRVDGVGGADHKNQAISPFVVEVLDETDGAVGEFGDDDVGICFTPDDGGKAFEQCPVWDVGMDQGEQRKFSQAPIRYVDRLVVRYCEVDGIDPTNCDTRTVKPLPDALARGFGESVAANFEDGIWRVRYNLSRQFPKS